jgi:hypothetical protein
MENQWASPYETREMIKRLIREEDADPVRYEVGYRLDGSDCDGDGDGADDFANEEMEASAGAENGDDDIMVHRPDEPSDAGAGAGAGAGVSTKNDSAAPSADSFDTDAEFFAATPATTAGASAMVQSLDPLGNTSVSTRGKRSSKVRIAP